MLMSCHQLKMLCLYLDSMASFRAELFTATLKGFNWDVRLCCPNAHAGHPVERHNRTLLELMRVLLLDAGMPTMEWSYAYLHGEEPTSTIELRHREAVRRRTNGILANNQLFTTYGASARLSL